MTRVATLGLLALLASVAHGAGWQDYELEIAPGFSVERMNSFEVCLSGPGGDFLVCPDNPPKFGPLNAYYVAEDSILTRHLGATADGEDPAYWRPDPRYEYYFRISRTDSNVDGPYSAEEWNRAGLPDVTAIEWVEPRNPNFWKPFLGNLMFLAFAAYYLVWPLVLVVFVVVGGLALWIFRRRSRIKAAV